MSGNMDRKFFKWIRLAEPLNKEHLTKRVYGDEKRAKYCHWNRTKWMWSTWMESSGGSFWTAGMAMWMHDVWQSIILTHTKWRLRLQRWGEDFCMELEQWTTVSFSENVVTEETVPLAPKNLYRTSRSGCLSVFQGANVAYSCFSSG